MIKDKMMDDTVAERGGKDFTNNGLLSDKSDATTGVVALSEDVAAELVDILYEMGFKFEFVAGLEFVFAGFLKGGI